VRIIERTDSRVPALTKCVTAWPRSSSRRDAAAEAAQYAARSRYVVIDGGALEGQGVNEM
jgi:hypothetical protein